MEVKIAIDCMGGDFGPEVTVLAAHAFLRAYPSSKIFLVGQRAPIINTLERHHIQLDDCLCLREASELVSMEDSPVYAMRSKKDSSMRVALNLVESGEADACLSAGNTGALMATARFVLKTLPMIDRPAICTTLPTICGHAHMLDLGANVNCDAEQLLQFGVMGSVMASVMDYNEEPSVGLLNIGEEDNKGTEVIKQAAELLRSSGLNFYGNVEGTDIYKGTTDVVVCDGFVGNVALKTSEGVAQMLTQIIREEFTRNLGSKLIAILSAPILNRIKQRVDHRNYNGAALVGLKKVVFKSHGSADVVGFEKAIERTAAAVSKGLVTRIEQRLQRTMGASH